MILKYSFSLTDTVSQDFSLSENIFSADIERRKYDSNNCLYSRRSSSDVRDPHDLKFPLLSATVFFFECWADESIVQTASWRILADEAGRRRVVTVAAPLPPEFIMRSKFSMVKSRKTSIETPSPSRMWHFHQIISRPLMELVFHV